MLSALVPICLNFVIVIAFLVVYRLYLRPSLMEAFIAPPPSHYASSYAQSDDYNAARRPHRHTEQAYNASATTLGDLFYAFDGEGRLRHTKTGAHALGTHAHSHTHARTDTHTQAQTLTHLHRHRHRHRQTL